MKIIYFDCGFGASGDMLTAALVGLCEDKAGVLNELNSMGIPGVEYKIEEAWSGGIAGNRMRVLIKGEEEPDDWQVSFEHHHDHDHHEHEHGHHHHHDHEHHDHEHDHLHHHDIDNGYTHRGMAEIEEIINSLSVSESVKANAIKVYNIIAEAESKAHGHPVSDVHFHEVGRMDAIADVTAVCYLIEKLSPERVIASPIAVGNGYVKCAHGIMPVPAPATLNILKGIPFKAGIIPSESCTPTGAALLKNFVDEFGPLPEIIVEEIGLGIGSRKFDGIAGGLRALKGLAI